MLARISFSPFDFTAVEYKLRHDAAEADLVLANGSAVFHPMPKLLFRLASMWKVTWSLSTARYTALSMGSVFIHEGSMQMLACLQEAAHGATGLVGSDQDDDTDEEDALLRQRQGFLKQACGRTQQDRGSKKRRARQPAQNRRTTGKSVAPVSNLDESADVEIEASWQNALERQDGVIPQAAPLASSSSRASGSKLGSTPLQPAVSAEPPPGLPWKDDKGYCFVMVADDVSKPAKKIYLGKNPRTVVLQKACLCELRRRWCCLLTQLNFRSDHGSASWDKLTRGLHMLR